MQSRCERSQEELFVAGPLFDLVPADHILRRIDGVVDFVWIHEEVREVYCQDNGRPSIDPESALRLMLAGFLEGIVHDRALMRRAQTDLAFRWFAGYRLDEKLPDHSSLTRIRQRWGAARFKRVFERVVRACVEAGLVKGETVHIDATLVRADVSWESLTVAHVERVLEANRESDDDNAPNEPPRRGRPRTKKPKAKKRSTTDPDASMATSNRTHHLEPSYKQHTAVDDWAGVIVDVAVDTGEANEGRQLLHQVERVESTTGLPVHTVTADKSYAHATNYGALEARGIEPVIPPQKTGQRKRGTQRIPARRFKYDARHQRVSCPAGNVLERKGRSGTYGGYLYRARQCDCQACPLRARCLPPSAKARSMVIRDGHDALLRARRKMERGWNDKTQRHYARHRWQVEGAHGRAKAHHGLRRAARRGRENMKIQAYLTAAAMNLKKLAAQTALTPAIRALHRALERLQPCAWLRPASAA